MRIWDDEHWAALTARHIQLAREFGSLSELPRALDLRTLLCLLSGDLTEATRLTSEAQAIEEATGTALAPHGELGLAAFRGDAALASTTAGPDATRYHNTTPYSTGEWARAVLCNGLGRHDDALVAARRAVSFDAGPMTLLWPHVELVEAAVRSDDLATATAACHRLVESTSVSGTNWALGIQQRTQALLSRGREAEELYRESISRFGRTRLRVELARAHLLYGEWLRQQRRDAEAREQLRIAHTMFAASAATAFAERASRELKAAGGALHKRVDATRNDELTAQEIRIAGMARDGLSNPEIAARLFVSAHTVQYHLRKVFIKLGVTSRSQLENVLPSK
jgi:DNA-binding CsgD family transcriptional regulator